MPVKSRGASLHPLQPLLETPLRAAYLGPNCFLRHRHSFWTHPECEAELRAPSLCSGQQIQVPMAPGRGPPLSSPPSSRDGKLLRGTRSVRVRAACPGPCAVRVGGRRAVQPLFTLSAPLQGKDRQARGAQQQEVPEGRC